MSEAKKRKARTAAEKFAAAARKLYRASRMCGSAASRDGLAMEKVVAIVTEACADALKATSEYIEVETHPASPA